MYSNEYDDEQEESKGSFIVNFYNNNKVLVWIAAGIVLFILLMSLLTRGGSNNRNTNINYDVNIIPEGDVFVLLGKSTNLVASVKNDPKAEFAWSVEDENVAKVDNGNVTGLDYGTTKVTATYIDNKNEKHTCTRVVTVAEGDPSIKLTDVSFKEGDLFMPLNDTYPIALTLTPARGYVESERFTSSNTSVVTVDNKGVVTSVGEGSAVVTFDVNNGQFRKELNVYVDREFNRTEIIVTPSKISFDGELRKIKVGTSERLSYTIEPEHADSSKFTWESSDESVLTVDEGRIKGISEGMAVVTVTALNGAKDRIDIEVESDIIQVTDINLSISDFYLNVGQSQIISPIVSPANASNKALSYASLDSSVASVTPNATGTQATIMGFSAGSTAIIIRSANNIEKRINVVVTGNQEQGGSGGSGGGSGSGGGGGSTLNQGFKISSSDARGEGFVQQNYSGTINNCAVAPLNVTVSKTSSSVNKLVVSVCNYSSDSSCNSPIDRYETTNSTTFSLRNSGTYVFKVEEYNSNNKLTRTTYKYACVGTSSGGGFGATSISNKTLYSSIEEAKAHPYSSGTVFKFSSPSDASYIKICWDTAICSPTSASAYKITSANSYSFTQAGTYAVRVAKYYSNSSTPVISTIGYMTISGSTGSGGQTGGSGGQTGGSGGQTGGSGGQTGGSGGSTEYVCCCDTNRYSCEWEVKSSCKATTIPGATQYNCASNACPPGKKWSLTKGCIPDVSGAPGSSAPTLSISSSNRHVGLVMGAEGVSKLFTISSNRKILEIEYCVTDGNSCNVGTSSRNYYARTMIPKDGGEQFLQFRCSSGDKNTTHRIDNKAGDGGISFSNGDKTVNVPFCFWKGQKIKIRAIFDVSDSEGYSNFKDSDQMYTFN